jgi:hypothetical protein
LKRRLAVAAVAVVGAGAAAVAVAQVTGGVSHAQPRAGSPPNLLASNWSAAPVVTGQSALENPAGIYTRYGYLDDHTTQADGQDTKTEPDQNTYLATARDPGGPTAKYDYGRHFLIQGHEVFGTPSSGVTHAYLTRVNLDVKDPSHRVTLLNAVDAADNTGLTSIDGSTYDPWSGQLLFTAESGNEGGVFATPLQWTSTSPPKVSDLNGSLGRAGYEGIHNDDQGNLMLLEDVGGSGVTDNGTVTRVKQPNSFVYRFLPTTPDDLTKGRLQALQVLVDGTPITFHPAATDPKGARDDALGDAILALHSGKTLQAKWVTIHDTAVDGTASFDANAAAKSKGATPLKRPENGKFVPGTKFGSFVFDETGDTDQRAGTYPGAAERASWGALLRLDAVKGDSDAATLRTIVVGDAAHASFDNVAFLDDTTVLVTEDRGDTLHQQLNALDSLWAFDITKPIGQINADAQRVEAQGRDPEATSDVGLREGGPTPLTHNEGDNELTGIHVSSGSISRGGILGAVDPSDPKQTFRVFVTGQHGANITYELHPPR